MRHVVGLSGLRPIQDGALKRLRSFLEGLDLGLGMVVGIAGAAVITFAVVWLRLKARVRRRLRAVFFPTKETQRAD